METESTTYNLLNSISYPEGLRKLSVGQLPGPCEELRQNIIQELSYNPGHFATSLGTMELTVTPHYVYSTPYGRTIWDMGHQAYEHKMLTGRREAFCTSHKFKSIRPFPAPVESDYGTFTCGHASNSISATLGMVVAATGRGEKDRHVVAVIDDNNISGGLAFEGLNNTSSTASNLLIILNDNGMAIDRSVGDMKQYLFNLTTSDHYNQLHFKASRILFKMGVLNEDWRKALVRFPSSLKSMTTQQRNIFEGMSIRYFGPVNGHDVKDPTRILRDIKDMQGLKILHLYIVKGKSFEPAEKNPGIWHAPGKFGPGTDERITTNTSDLPPLYQTVFGETLAELAEKDPEVVGITPTMPTGRSMSLLMKAMPDRAFGVGIAEGHAATFSGGMAKEGLQPFCDIYSSFMQRAYDGVVHDIAILKLPVVLCLDRAGLVDKSRPTHHGVYGLAYFHPILNLTISSPTDKHELRRLMYAAQLPDKGPFVIRYPRGRGVLVNWKCPLEGIPVSRGRKLKDGKDLAIVTLGSIENITARAIERAKTDKGVSIAHYDLRFLKPLDETLLHEVGRDSSRILTIEDGARKGGMRGAVLKFMANHDYTPHIRRIGVPDTFIEHGTVQEPYRLRGMDEEGIYSILIKNDKWRTGLRHVQATHKEILHS